MSKKFKTQASAASARAASSGFATSSSAFGFSASPSAKFQTAVSSLSYITEQPDLSTISNTDLVVTLRNLGKKDSTTKTKALEELQEYVNRVSSGEHLEAGFLDAWISLYPRTSIDNARRVRQLAHTVQGHLTALAGKRIAPHLPKVIGAWLSGAYDSDRLVARTAQDSLATAFATEEKRQTLWKAYKNSLVEYANDAILVQSPQTLSDERSTTPDDAEAKYVRVVGNGVQLLSQVIKMNKPATGQEVDAGHVGEGTRTILREKRLWEYASHEDPTLRRAICSLASSCSKSMSQELDWETMSTCFIGKALHSSQLGSSRSLSGVLLDLTSVRPSIWTTDYTSKTATSKRLFQYLRKGSQRGPADFWVDIGQLLRKIPVSAWAATVDNGKVGLDDASSLLDSFYTGVTNKEEPRQNLESAWSAYVDLSFWLLGVMSDDQSKTALLENSVSPVVSRYVTSDSTQNNENSVLSVLINMLQCGMTSLFERTWNELCQCLADSMRLSLPESSKDHSQSQNRIVAQAQRLLRLRNLILDAPRLSSTGKAVAAETIRGSDDELIATSIEVLKARNGKPFGIACILERMALAAQPHPKSLESFLESNALSLLASPSAEYLVGMFLFTERGVAQILPRLLTTSDTANVSKARGRLFQAISEDDLSQHPEIESFILDQIPAQINSDTTQQIVKAVLLNPKLASSTLCQNCCQKLVDGMLTEVDTSLQQAVIRYLILLHDELATHASPLFSHFGSLLLTRTLLLSEIENDATAEFANSLLAKLKTTSQGDSSTTASSVAIVADQLSGKGDPLPVFTLIDLAKDILNHSSSQQQGTAYNLLPTASHWLEAIDEHLHHRPPVQLSITSPLRGLIFLVSPAPEGIGSSALDADGFSPLFRLALYTTKMLHETNLAATQSESEFETLYQYYPLALQIINEKLTLEVANTTWQNFSDQTEVAADLLSQGNTLMQKWIEDDKMLSLWTTIMRSMDILDARTHYYNLAFSDLASRSVDAHGITTIMSAFATDTEDLHRADIVRSASLISICRDHLVHSQQGRKLLNELVAVATGLQTPSSADGDLKPLVLLDLLLNGDSEPLENIPSQRQNFLMQNLVRMLSEETTTSAFQTLATRLLDPVTVAIKDLYGEHWDQILECLSKVLDNGSDLDEDLPLLHASLRLYGRLISLVQAPDANEDIVEACNSKQHSLEDGLLACLDSFKDATTTINQPRRITAELLMRQLSQIKARHDRGFYPLLSSTEDAVRAAAYDLLHRSIPAEQEQVSLDFALEHKVAHLPPELLSLLAEVHRNSQTTTQSTRRGYLLCWNLVFDHFPKASHKVQECYAADIKENNVLPKLLDLICEICRITSNRPVVVSKTKMTELELGLGETDELEDQHLSVHLYYRCLLHLPGLTRSWFIEQKNRIKSPLEGWTQRYFAPTLISTAASTVTEWVAAQSGDEDDSLLTVKTSMSGTETVASIAVDPESPPISLAITLPKSYPLESPTVSTRTRVVVSEKNWQSWLRTIQIIIFSTGSIIEGLIAFRRNVQGAVKGQSECAICYSIIGTDMQTPNKRCGTCRNNFHGTCLFRWFKSSNSSSCPLCRNNFNYA